MRFSRVFPLVACAALHAGCEANDPSNQAPTPVFTFECDALACSFSNGSADSDGTIEAYDWDFGENSARVRTRDAAHTYAAGGRFTVTLTVTDDDGEVATAAAPVDVSDSNVAPTAKFTSSCTELTCHFTNQSFLDGSMASYRWDFGDSGTSRLRNPSHSYAASGRFTVKLTVTDGPRGTATATAEVNVNIAPMARFAHSCIELTCSFTDQSFDYGGSLVSYRWAFGDGQTSSKQSPQHTFTTAGTYAVELTVTDGVGVTGHASMAVAVPPSPGAPAFDFSTTCSGLKCSFTDETTPQNGWLAWHWKFGDGGTSTERNPTHVYDVTEPTTFTVTLSVSDSDFEGESGVVSHEVTVAPPE